MLVTRAKRKLEHLHHAINLQPNGMTGFEDIRFVHQSIPNCSLDQVDIGTNIGELKFSSPFFINAMTGGGGKGTLVMNQKLGVVARETNLAIAVGSQMAAIKNSEEIETYKIIRKEYPNGCIIGNLGSEATVDDAKKAIEMIEANALQIHLNTIQELTMPEGDKSFTNTLHRIEKIRSHIDVPLIVKEVGFGMSIETVRKLAQIGVTIVDIGGYGGTNFAQIENARREHTFDFFNDWGIPTAISIIEAKEAAPHIHVIGSGGIQTSFDIVKALSIGASTTALAGKFLRLIIENQLDEVMAEIERMKMDIAVMMTALGARNVFQLQNLPLIISGFTHHWLMERGIDTKQFSQRNL